MDIRHEHGADVQVVRASPDFAGDMVAIGGMHTVQVLLATPTASRVLANFHIGCRVTAIAWSARCTSPTTADEWSIELTAAGANFGLYLLTKAYNVEEEVFAFGGGLSGHHGKVNDMSFCGGQSEDSWRYVATVSDDKMLMVWDLHPPLTSSPSASTAGALSSPPASSSPPPSRRQPTAYVITFPHPLTTVCAHPSTSKEFLVADARGSIFLTDWRSDPSADERVTWRNSSVVELVEPRALADAVTGASVRWAGSVAWRKDDVNMVGASYGSRFSLWDLGRLQGGKPFATVPTFPEGGTKFRWCTTFPDLFAVTTNNPQRGATIHVYNFGYLQAQPTVFTVAQKPLYVRDFDFMGSKGVPRIVAAVGREVIIFAIGVED